MTLPNRSKLAGNQQDIWFDQLARPLSPLYNIGGRLIIDGEVHYDLLDRALRKLVDENESLRLQIEQTNGHPSQTVRVKQQFDLPFLDFSKAAQPEESAIGWLQKAFEQPFANTPETVYWYFALIKVSSRQYQLLTKYHHVIADGWSTKIAIDRLAELYNALLQNQPPTPADATRYLEFVEQEQRYLASEAYRRDAEFWQSYLPVLPDPLIQHKYSPTAHLDLPKAHIHRFTFSRGFYSKLGEWTSNSQSTIYQLLLSVVCTYFSRIYQRRRIVIGIPALNRSGARFKQVFGLFASLSPLMLDPDPNMSARQFVAHSTTAIRRIHRHQRYPLSEINHRLHVMKNKRAGLFDLVVSYERQDYASRFGQADVRAQQLFSGVARYPLAITICEFNDNHDVEVIFEGAATCFTAQELTLLAGRLQFILQQFIDNPETRLGDIDLVPEDEKHSIFRQFNNSRSSTPPFISVLELFKRWTESQPHAIAVKQQNRILSYADLDHYSDRLAARLSAQNPTSGRIVAVCMPRRIEAIVALLAIFKSNAIYLPLDYASPQERIADTLAQSDAHTVLTVSDCVVRLAALHANVVATDDLLTQPLNTVRAEHVEGRAASVLDPISPNDIAYVIYTSGSTGQTKGSKIDHKALSARIGWLQNAFNIQAGEPIGQTVQTSFDPSLIEILLALTQGGRLVLPSWERITPEALADFVVTEQIHAMALVPTSLKALLQGLPEKAATALRVVCCGGETLPANLTKAFIARTGARLFNVYGPTETTILASAWQCGPDDNAPLPIGRPIDHTQIFITDKDLNLMPLGVEGEIVIAGIGVGQGYWQQPLLSAAAFVTNPFLSESNGLLYRTGDCGFIGTDCQLYFSERLDRQIKISGYRIEPAEIENLLMQHPDVQLAAVTAFATAKQKILAAYIETATDRPQELKKKLSDYLRRRVPDYMQPRSITLIDAIPVTATGKIAYAELPPPALPDKPSQGRHPTTRLESQLLEAWRQTLKNPTLTVEDNFFELDTDSLAAISLMIHIEKLTGLRYSIAFLLAYPTVASQAEQISLEQPQCSDSLVTTLSRHAHPPHFYLAVSGNGDQLRFQALADALGECCTLHMLHPAPVDNTITTIQQIAEQYAELILSKNTDSYYLGGFSIGGITALETARLLQRHGCAPRNLILLDTIYPRWPLRSPWLFKALQWLSRLYLVNKISLNGRKLHAMLADPGIIVQLTALGRHKIRPYQGPVNLVLSTDMWLFHPLLFSTWTKLLGNNIATYYVPGLHGAIFRDPHLQRLTAVIRRCLNV